jgi:hypothetical protein
MNCEASLIGIRRTGGRRIATIRFDDGAERELSVKGIRRAKPPEPTDAEMLSELFAARGWNETKVRWLAKCNALEIRDVYDAVFKEDDAA